MKATLWLMAAVVLCAPLTFAGDKEDMQDFVANFQAEMETLKATGSDPVRLGNLMNAYNTLRNALGGDDPIAASDGPITGGGPPGPPATPAAPPGTTATTSNHVNAVATAIADLSSNTSTITVVGAETYLWDVDLTTNISHTWAADLDVTLTSPAGTVVTITTDNGGSNDDVYDGSVFDDQETATCTDFTYANLVTAGPFAPEGELHAFRGEDPNGIWTLDCADDAAGDSGSFTWEMDLTTLNFAPADVTTNHVNAVATTISDLQSNTSTITVVGADDYLCDVNLTTNITHTWAADLDVTLTSPAGTVVTITTDNGGSNDDVYDGSLFNGQEADTVTDFTYANLVTAGPFTPEGALAAFVGEDPNGIWTLDCADDAAGDSGSFTWEMDLTTCSLAECFLVFGDGPGTGQFFPGIHNFDVQVTNPGDYYAVLLDNIPEFVISSAADTTRRETSIEGPAGPAKKKGGGSTTGTSATAGGSGSSNPRAPVTSVGVKSSFAVQVVMWNPEVFPAFPEQYTHGLYVQVMSDDTVRTRVYGEGTGMEVWAETFVNEKGDKVLRFPFSIPGM